MTLTETFHERKVDYLEVIDKCDVLLCDKKSRALSIIIPVCGRIEFNEILVKSLRNSLDLFSMSATITFVEHSEQNEHRELCAKNGVNHIYIPKHADEKFNKCLCHNVGALYFTESTYIHFHDVDTIMTPDFYDRVFANIGSQNADAIQCFTKQRLLLCDLDLTIAIIMGGTSVSDLCNDTIGVRAAQAGAVGGSMLLRRELFHKIGGFAPEFFSQYSIEDAFFWDCIQVYVPVSKCNDPEVELFHLHHPPSFNRTTKECDWDIFHTWRAMSNEQRDALTIERSNHLKNFL